MDERAPANEYEAISAGDFSRFDASTRSALEFATAFTDLGARTPRSYLDDLARHFTPLQTREIVLLAAWQAAGLRAIASWRREESLDSRLPLAYSELAQDEDRSEAPILAPPAKPDPVLARELYDHYVSEWSRTAGPPAEWAVYLMEAPHAFWGWAEFHRLAVVDGLNDPRVIGGVVAYLAALEGHQTWAANVEANRELWHLSDDELDALRACDLSGFDDTMRAVLGYVEEMTYSSGVGDQATARARAVLSPGQLVGLGMFAGLHLASIRIDLARNADATGRG
jgi:hypothetical protein